jgi:serine/threonine protein kinase
MNSIEGHREARARALPAERVSSSSVDQSPAQHLLAPGQIVANRYCVDELLATSAISVLYRAHHVELRSPVALEVMHPGVGRDSLVWRRFARQARALAALHNQHVVRVHDWGRLDSGPRYLVMELLKGTPLGTILAEEGPFAPARAVECVIQVCSALADAHALGIVHRDVRLENVFVARYRAAEPVIKLLNFGTALFVAEAGQLTIPGWGAALTHHFSPEQLMNPNAVDARSDIWAVGLLLFELLSGRSLYAGLSTAQIGIRIAYGPLPGLEGLRPTVPPELCALIRRCLEHDPALRPPNADQLIRELQPFSNRPTHAPFALTQVTGRNPKRLQH